MTGLFPRAFGPDEDDDVNMTAQDMKNNYRDTASEYVPHSGFSEWIEAARKNSFDLLKQTGFPTKKWESWKYVNLLPILEKSYTEPGDDSSFTKEVFSSLPFSGEQFRAVLVNGVFREDLSTIGTEGLALESIHSSLIKDAAPIHTFGTPAQENNPFVLANAARLQGGVNIRIKKNLSLPGPLHVFIVTSGGTGESIAAHPRIAITACENSLSDVILHFCPLAGAAFTNAVCEVNLLRNASLDLIVMQENRLSHDLFFAARVGLDEASRLDCVSVSRGGGMIRNDFQIDLMGPEAYADVSGIGVLSGSTALHNEIVVNHRSPMGVSRQLFKNILTDETQGEFNSLAYVHAGAQKSDSQQLNKNLLLSRSAKAYSRPSLKIYADDVKASHGSATGRTEQQEFFYLQSRGLDKKLARFVLTFGFAEEVLMKISVDGIRQAAENFIRRALEEMMPEYADLS